MTLGQALLDGVLARQQPIECRIQLVLVGMADPEQLAERAIA
jgi:hypothetical protein